MKYHLEIKYQRCSVGRRSGFSGPNSYVAVQCVPDTAQPLRVLNRRFAKQRGITIRYFGEGYRSHDGPRSRLGKAIAAAKAFITEQTEHSRCAKEGRSAQRPRSGAKDA